MNLIEKLESLYNRGMLNGGVFEKTAKIIYLSEMEKLASTLQDTIKEILRLYGEVHGEKELVKEFRNLESLSAEAAEVVLRQLKEKIKLMPQPGGLIRRGFEFMNKHKPAVVAGSIASVIAADKLMEYINKKKKDQTIDSNFHNLLNENQDIDEFKAQKNFQTLKSIAPDIALDPAASEGYLRQMNEYPYLPFPTVKEISQTQKNISDTASSNSDFTKALGNLGKSLTSLFALG